MPSSPLPHPHLTTLASSLRYAVCVCFFTCAVNHLQAQARYSIIEIGRVFPGRFSHSAALNINDRGQIVGNDYTDGVEWRSFIWHDGTLTNLNLSGSSHTI